MKFRLSTVLLWITIFCLAIGWFCERGKRFDESRRMDAFLSEQGANAELFNCIAMVGGINTAYSNIQQQQLNKRSASSYHHQKQEDLACCLIALYQMEMELANDKKEFVEDLQYLYGHPHAILRSSATSLELFEYTTVEQVEKFFTSRYREYKFGGYEKLLYSSSKRLNPDFSDFVKRSLEFQKTPTANFEK